MIASVALHFWPGPHSRRKARRLGGRSLVDGVFDQSARSSAKACDPAPKASSHPRSTSSELRQRRVDKKRYASAKYIATTTDTRRSQGELPRATARTVRRMGSMKHNFCSTGGMGQRFDRDGFLLVLVHTASPPPPEPDQPAYELQSTRFDRPANNVGPMARSA